LARDLRSACTSGTIFAAVHSLSRLAKKVKTMVRIDYSARAGLFPPKRRSVRGHLVGSMWFNSAAEAIRFAIEELPAEVLLGTYLRVDHDKVYGDAIRKLYENAGYPLDRRAKSAA
jgi:hypothetical protein